MFSFASDIAHARSIVATICELNHVLELFEQHRRAGYYRSMPIRPFRARLGRDATML